MGYTMHMDLQTLKDKWGTFSFARKAAVISVIIVVSFIILSIATWFITGITRTMYGVAQGGSVSMHGMPPMIASDSYSGYSVSGKGASLSVPSYRNDVAYEQSAVTKNAEKFERTSYDATIESRHFDEDCETIHALKVKDEIIFVSSSQGKTSCQFSFKVEKGKESTVLSTLKSLSPKNLNESIYTIEQQITDITRQKEILESQLQSIDVTLKDAIASYEQVTKLSVQSLNAEALAAAINNKIDLIDRLSARKLSIQNQIQSLTHGNDDNLQSIQYVQFNVYITKDMYVDIDAIKASWKYEVKNLLNTINGTIEDITLGFIAVLLLFGKYILYLFTAVFLLKIVKKGLVWLWKQE